MAKFDIMAKGGGSVRFSGYPTYNGTYLKPAYIEFRNVSSDNVIGWQVGDYCSYTGSFGRQLTYKLYDIPQPTRKGPNGACGEAIVYESVKLYAQTKGLEICPFRDVVVNDNYVHFSTRNTVATFEPLSTVVNDSWQNDSMVSRIQKNLDDFYGSGVWNVVMYSGLDDESDLGKAVQEARAFSLEGGSVLDALNSIYELWDNIGWYYTVESGVHTITIGRPNVQDSGNTSPEFQYGKGNGLVQIKQSQVNASEFGTRIYAYGSDRNMNMQYYKGDTDILNAASLDVQNLMIPKSYWGQTEGKYDASKAYIQDNTKVTKYGLIPKFHYFNGSDDDEIYPTLKGMTIQDVKTWKSRVGDSAYVPSEVYANTDRVDKILSADSVTDNGVYSQGGLDTMTQQYQRTDTRAVTLTPQSPVLLISDNTFTAISDGQIIAKATATISPAPSSPKVGLSIYVYINNSLAYSHTQWQNTGTDFALESRVCNVLKGENVKVEVKIGSVINSYTGTCVSTATLSCTNSEFVKTFKIRLRQIGFDIRSRQALGSNGLATIFINGGTRTGSTSNCAGRSFVVKDCQYVTNLAPFYQANCVQCGLCASYAGCPTGAFSFDASENQPSIDLDTCVLCGDCGTACPNNALGLIQTTDYWELTCVRCYDESLGLAFPNVNYTIEAGDEFVLLDIAMPDLYIAAAEQRLYNAALERYNLISEPQKFLAPEMDPITMLGNGTYALVEGTYMAIKDTDLTGGTAEYTLIDSVSIAEGEGALPKITVGLREEKGKTFIESVQSTQSSTPITSVNSLSVSNVEIAQSGTCATAAATVIKTVKADNFSLSVGSVIRVFFQTANTAANPQLQVGYDSNHPMKAYSAGSKVWIASWDAGTTLDFRYDGTDWVVVGNPIVSSQYGTGRNADYYELYANGRLHCWGSRNVAASTTDIAITFAKSFSGPYYCVTASTSQGANPGTDPGAVWIDAKTAAGCAFHWTNTVAVELTYDVQGFV